MPWRHGASPLAREWAKDLETHPVLGLAGRTRQPQRWSEASLTRLRQTACVSDVTNLLVSFHGDESDELIHEFTAWFDDRLGIRNLAAPDANAFWGGGKHPEVEHLWAGAYNHLDLDGLRRYLASLQWAHPDAVQIFVRAQWDTRFQVWSLSKGDFRQLVDGLPE